MRPVIFSNVEVFFRTFGCCLQRLASYSEYVSYSVTFLVVDVHYEVLGVGRI